MIAYSEALKHLLDAATPLPAERLPREPLRPALRVAG